MFRTYQLHTSNPRRQESLHAIVRRVERELAADPERAIRRRAVVMQRARGAFPATSPVVAG